MVAVMRGCMVSRYWVQLPKVVCSLAHSEAHSFMLLRSRMRGVTCFISCMALVVFTSLSYSHFVLKLTDLDHSKKNV